MSQATPNGDAQAAAIMKNAATHCMRETAELQSRLTAGWMHLLTRGVPLPSAVAAWSLEAMRLTAETTMHNIEHCQNCASQAASAPK